MTSSSRCHSVVSSKQKAGKACISKQEHGKIFGALTKLNVYVWRVLHSKQKWCVTSYFSYPDLLKIHSNYIFKFCKNKMKNLKTQNYLYIKSVFELPFGISLFPYIIHMGLSSILQIFDSTEMECSLCFLIKKNVLKFS